VIPAGGQVSPSAAVRATPGWRGARQAAVRWALGAVWACWVAPAQAAPPPACETLSPPASDQLAVAWLSPIGRRAQARTWLTVVPAADLRDFIDREHADLVRTLRYLGVQRHDRAPRHAWKVVVFDVPITALCRPVRDATPGMSEGGVTVCPDRHHGVDGRDDRCGRLVDTVTGQPGITAFQIPWEDAAIQGFCVLPMERFLQAR
jgi:hypothetical protein